MTKLRKTFIVSVMSITVLSMSMIAVPLQVGAAASAGDLIKMDGLSSVYYLGADGKRYVFPNESTYFSWYADFSGVVTVPQSELESYPLGANVTMRPGTKLVKITTDPKVYAVEPNGTLKWVPDETTASTLWGANWAQRVVDVPDAFFTNYTIDSGQVSAAAYPTGSLVKFSGSADVYYIASDGTARKVSDEAVMAANRLNWDDVITAPDTVPMPTAGTEITGAESAIIDTSSGAGGTAGAGTGLTVSLASDTPASATTIGESGTGGNTGGSQAMIPVLKVNFTAAADGSVKVTKVMFKRGGIPSDDTDFADFYLYNGNTLLAKYGSISEGVLSFNSAAGLFTVPAGTTMTVTLKVSLAYGIGASRAYNWSILAASDVVTDGAVVSGTFPISGNTFATANVTDLGTITIANSGTLSAPDPGTTQHTIWKFTLTPSDQAVQIERMKFTIIGTVDSTDLANFTLSTGGVQVGPTVAAMSSDKTIDFVFDTPYVFAKGASVKTFSLKADIAGGTNRTYQVYLYSKEDVVARDNNYGVYLTLNQSSDQSNTYTRVNGSSKTINAGSLTVSKNTSSPTGNVAVAATGVEVARYDFKAVGEDIKVDTIYLYSNTAGAANGQALYQVKMYVDGSQIGTTQNLSDGVTATTSIGNSLIIPAGQTKTLVVKADIKQSASTNITANGTIQISLKDGSASYSCAYTKQSSGGVGNGATAAGNTLTAKAGTVTVAKNVSFGSKTSSNPTGTVNAAAVKIASFVITAGGGEAVDITQITLQDDATTQVGDNFQNLLIKHGDTQLGNTVSNPNTTAGTYDFDLSPAARVAAGAQYVVDVYADVKSSPQDSGKELLPVIKVDAVAATGVDTSQDASATSQALSLQQAYIASAGSLRVSTDPDTPIGMPLVMGVSDQAVAKFKLEAGPEEAIEITDITVHDRTTTAQGGSGTYYNLSLYNGDTLVAGPVQFGATAASTTATYTIYAATFTGLNITIPASQSLVLTAKVDVASYTAGGTSASQHAVGFFYDSALSDAITARGASSGTTITGTSLDFAVSGDIDADQLGEAFVVYRTMLLAAWHQDTPSGVSSGGTGKTIAVFTLTNTANPGNYSATLSSINLNIDVTGISATATRTLTIYKDSTATTALCSTTYGGAVNYGDTNFPLGTLSTQISANASKTFYVTLDTNDASTNDNLSVRLAANDVYWSDGISTTSLIPTLPLAAKTLTY